MIRPETIIGLRFATHGVSVPDHQIQATWRRHVEAERAERRKPLTQEQDAAGLDERRWSQR